MTTHDKSSLHGLYAITDSLLCPSESLRNQVREALLGGARIIQYRDKNGNHQKCLSDATALQRLCREYNALLIINDNVKLAKQSGSDGVHLGRDDLSMAIARDELGEKAIIGISCYNRLELAHQAAAAGADYIALGRFFASTIKPEAVQADLKLLTDANKEFELPLVAIGGITPENGASLIAAGADMLAVIHGIFGQPDIQVASHSLCRLFELEEKII
ncbi:MAG: thiamine phosphate synthase [Candidatus Thiodiazotropha sp. (ex Lucinoma aequizonata)]|nr:thiamine phosphate synthase [Candidatus Thiodiazotropha sp. (ex Lucinoma aequizonata)]MCU7888943.1 thiamine phosphate synthase [Candidatus Thiodiazotropha sp. (ex Lucinoma aequizonata)]MCU7895455.1 thiamine phosphate synthase [Candidatus Thiodiazotropha sp. (ex Lucinoma aequizonata)]MCU7899114.1 thiamine phosphate synthase [Candidatus Thiodiazotropha sp. (ex Lucinoma aequizonata)]MCU7903741.1 thiamine phosphate synthase [Candidatus Thiodiazotropha sp. (ex Lucinoma aequizonata)]